MPLPTRQTLSERLRHAGAAGEIHRPDGFLRAFSNRIIDSMASG
jgi:hypothetical protein